MLTQEEKDQLEAAKDAIEAMSGAIDIPNPTPDELEQIKKVTEDLAAISETIEAVSEQPITNPNVVSHKLADISKLVPSGNLDKLKERIAGRMPISDEQYKALVNAMKDDIRANSRLNGLLKNVSVVAQTLVTKVLPLFLA